MLAQNQREIILKSIREQFNKGNEISAVYVENLQKQSDKSIRKIRKKEEKRRRKFVAAVQPQQPQPQQQYVNMDIDPNISSDDDRTDRTDELLKNYNEEKDFLFTLKKNFEQTKSDFYTRTDWFVLIRKLLIRKRLLQPNKLFYWEIWLMTFSLVGEIVSFFLENPQLFSK